MAEGKATWDVFLSYASPDRPQAHWLYDALTALGLRVFFDQESLAPGDDWHQNLTDHIRRSSVGVGLISEHTSDAHYQRAELIEILKQRRRLMPVRLADVDLPFGLGQLHAVDLFDPTDVPSIARRIATVASGDTVSGRVFSSRIPRRIQSAKRLLEVEVGVGVVVEGVDFFVAGGAVHGDGFGEGAVGVEADGLGLGVGFELGQQAAAYA